MCLAQVCEDSPLRVEDRITSAGNMQASRLLLPPVLQLFGHPTADIRRQAVSIFNMLVHDMPSGLIDTLDAWVAALRLVLEPCCCPCATHTFR
jgi:hypothetical protein